MLYRQRVKMLLHGRLRSMTNLERVVRMRRVNGGGITQ